MAEILPRDENAAQPDLSGNPIFSDFVNQHSDYVRIHVHLSGLFSTNATSSTTENALERRRNRLGAVRVIDAVADPYVTVDAIGSTNEGGGATDYFPIGHHKFTTLRDTSTPVWDSKCLLLCKKDALEGLKFVVWDANGNRADEALVAIEMSKDELPDPLPLADAEWTSYTKMPTSDTDYRTEHVALEFSILITEGDDQIVSSADMEAIYSINDDAVAKFGLDGYTYSEMILAEDAAASGDMSQHALVQSWTNPNSTKAVLWVLGRNDCFMHPHVAKSLFWGEDHGYDLYVLNYKMNGQCRRCGWVQDPHYNSHNFKGDFDVYNNDIAGALKHIESVNADYEKVLGYAHSTGGPILLNYLIEVGDEAFDGFLFNSPFLDWGFVGGDLLEFVLENTGILQKLGTMNLNSKVGVAKSPDGTSPTMYLGEDVILSEWSAPLWSLYHFDWASRPLYKVPMTVGFAQGVTGVHTKIATRHKIQKKPVTAKPFLCITSRGDDVLKAPETLSRADWIGPSRWEIELNDNGHDVFLSYDPHDTEMAISMCSAWMKNRRF